LARELGVRVAVSYRRRGSNWLRPSTLSGLAMLVASFVTTSLDALVLMRYVDRSDNEDLLLSSVATFYLLAIVGIVYLCLRGTQLLWKSVRHPP